MDALGPVLFYLGLFSLAVWMLLFGSEYNKRQFSIRSILVATAIIAVDLWIVMLAFR